MTRPCLIVGHRGARGLWPENTLAAFSGALALGVDALELDVAMTADGGLIETQATAEKGSFSRAQLNSLVDLAEVGLKEIFAAQRAVLGF